MANLKNSQRRRESNGGEFGLNDLPSDVVSKILSNLNPKEAFRARSVSPSWRHVRIPPFQHINLDSQLIFGRDYPQIMNNAESKILQDQFVNKVKRFLAVEQSFTNPTLLSFKVSFYLGKKHNFEIENWIRYAVRKECETIELDFTRQARRLFEFPCRLLPLGEDSKLRHLSLKECCMSSSLEEATRFNCLISLALVSVTLGPNVIETINSGCLKLERLELSACPVESSDGDVPPMLNICGDQLPCLKTLRVRRCSSLKKIMISSVCLQTFDFEGTAPWENDTLVEFLDVPFLTDVSVSYCTPNSFYTQLARDVPNLQNLSLTTSNNKVSLPDTKFSYLKKLVIQLIKLEDFDLMEITHVLEASPVLEKFKIIMHDAAFGSSEYNCVGLKMKCSERHEQQHKHLNEVEIKWFSGKWNAFAFTEHLLQNAIKLERMVIHTDKSCSCSNCERKLQDLFSLASSRAELIVM